MTQYEMVSTIADLSAAAQDEFYNRLRLSGFSEDEILAIQSQVFYFKMFNDPAFYNAVKTAVGSQLYAEFTR